MRTGFRRGRLDKVQQPGAINSYSAALYPPRAYHYYTVPYSGPLACTTVIVGPSIDDGVGDSRGRESTSCTGASTPFKRSPPLLSEFTGCFVDADQCTTEARAFDIVAAANEILNPLHYPSLLNAGKDETTVTCGGCSTPHAGGDTYEKLRWWEEALNLPSELRCYSVAGQEMTNTVIESLKIRPVKRKRLVKPMRRGAKVFVYDVCEELHDDRKVKKNAGEEEDQRSRGPTKTQNGDRDVREEDVDGGQDKEDDEASLSYRVDDDDDGGDLDGPEGSGDENDYF